MELGFQTEPALEQALWLFKQAGSRDYADCLHVALASHAGQGPLLTFDERASRIEGAQLDCLVVRRKRLHEPCWKSRWFLAPQRNRLPGAQVVSHAAPTQSGLCANVQAGDDLTEVYQARVSLQSVTQQSIDAVSNAAQLSILDQAGGVLGAKPMLGKPGSGQGLTARSLCQQCLE